MYELRRKSRLMEKVVKFAVRINQCYKYLILLSIALGGLLPQIELFRSLMPYLIVIMTGSLALTYSKKDLSRILQEPSSLLLGLTFMFGVAPLLSYVLSLSLLSRVSISLQASF
jgi:predicted Na+-dependent transporter